MVADHGEREMRQGCACTACRRLVATIGALATIGARGELRAGRWHAPDIPAHYAAAVRPMARRVDDAGSSSSHSHARAR
jgi:hypothetical protein